MRLNDPTVYLRMRGYTGKVILECGPSGDFITWTILNNLPFGEIPSICAASGCPFAKTSPTKRTSEG